MDKKNSRKALGRGLSNLIPVKFDDADNNSEIHLISIEQIQVNPFQPRLDFDDDEIRGLAESIRTQGLLQPVVVRKKDTFYQIISGERRFRALQFLKRDSVPCIVKNNVSDREMLELALIENVQREELNEIEKALAYQKLLLEYSYTHEQLSAQIGKSRTAITNSLRLLNLPEEIQLLVRKNSISMGHARALLSFGEDEQKELVQKIIDANLSVRDVENIKSSPKKGRKKKGNTSTAELADPDITEIVDKLQYKFGTSVIISNSSKKKGMLSFQFFGQEDLSRIIDLMLQ